MELLDLVDPTESRYAVVAQEMLLTNDWVTPKLAEPEGVIPYLGKPPLHYWFTAAIYSLFGVEEWTSRLPSFLGGLFIVGCLVTLGRRLFFLEIGLLASLVFISSPLVFFFVGASVVDITLTVCLTAAFTTFALGINEKRPFAFYIYFLSLALGFLTKGPVALVLGLVPAIIFLSLPNERKSFKEVPWISGLVLFALVSIPWFVVVESRNPGFLRYFIINENLLRFTVADYGDRYGHGNVYFRGSSIWMFAVATLPWFLFGAILAYRTIPSIRSIYNEGKKSENRWFIYSAIWGLMPIFFFGIARQLHAAYLIPAIPPMALLFSAWGSRIRGFATPFHTHIFRYSTSVSLVLTLVIIIFGDYAGERKSTESILQLIAQETSSSQPVVGSTAVNCYSQYWVAGAWRQELGEQLTVKYVAPEMIQTVKLPNLILRDGFYESHPQEYLRGYVLQRTIGKWSWWRLIDSAA